MYSVRQRARAAAEPLIWTGHFASLRCWVSSSVEWKWLSFDIFFIFWVTLIHNWLVSQDHLILTEKKIAIFKKFSVLDTESDSKNASSHFQSLWLSPFFLLYMVCGVVSTRVLESLVRLIRVFEYCTRIVSTSIEYQANFIRASHYYSQNRCSVSCEWKVI